MNAQEFYQTVWIKEHADDVRGDWPIRMADAFAAYRAVPTEETGVRELVGKISEHIAEITGPTGGWLDSPAHMQAWLKSVLSKYKGV